MEPIEERLTGGNVSDVVRVGDTVRRLWQPWSPAVHHLLDRLARFGGPDVPASTDVTASDARSSSTSPAGGRIAWRAGDD